MPDDDPDALLRRTRVGLPDAASTARSGCGETADAPAPARAGAARRAPAARHRALGVHWSWFFVPHGTVAWLLLRHHDRYVRGAMLMAATFDLGLVVYWARSDRAAVVRRRERASAARAADHGRGRGARLERRSGGPLYDSLEGNPFAAMPSLHFGTSVMAARVLSDVGRGPGALGWTYALTLGFGLVYLGEHYVRGPARGLRAGGDRPAARARRDARSAARRPRDPAAGAGGGVTTGRRASLRDGVEPDDAELDGADLEDDEEEDAAGRRPRGAAPDRRKLATFARDHSCSAIVGDLPPAPEGRRASTTRSTSIDDADVVLGRDRGRSSTSPAFGAYVVLFRGVLGGRAGEEIRAPARRRAPPTRSPWPGWRPRASSRRPAPAGSSSPTGRCARPACRGAGRPAGWSRSWC